MSISTHSTATDLVAQAAHAFYASSQPRPDAQALTAALLELEKTAKQTKGSIPLESLLGTWRLCFSAGKQAKLRAGKPTGSGFYVPKIAIARITFAKAENRANTLEIANELKIGPLLVRFTGPVRYPGKKNLLAFDFTHLQVSGFGLKIYQGAISRRKKAAQSSQSFSEIAIAQLPFFAFFAATDDYIAARGRGGGLAIWVRPE